MTSPDPTPRMQRSRAVRLVIALLVMVPLVLSAVYMWVLWDPTKTVKDMPVAIVNQDRGYTDDSGSTDAGKRVADNLVKSGSLDFKQVERQRAYEGLRSGRYYFVLDIPQNFSENLKNITEPGAAASMITVTFNDYNTLKASSIGGSAMEKIHQSVLKGIASTTVGGLVDGVQRLGDGLRTAADGSGQLKDGTATLKDGTQTLNKGITNDLAPGVKRASEGATQLNQGANTLADGLVTLQKGTDTLGDGATQVADGIERLVTMVPLGELQAAIKQAQAAAPGNTQIGRLAELVDGLGRLKAGSRQVADQLTNPNAKYRGGVNKLVDGGAQLKDGTSRLATGLTALDAGVGRLADGSGKIADGVTRLHDGTTRLNQGLSDGAAKAPDFGDEKARATLAQLMATPVTKETNHVARAQFSGPGGAPTILLIATMLVPIMVLLTFRGHRFVTDDEMPRSRKALGRRVLAVGGISLAVMVLVGILAFISRDPSPDPANMTQVVVITALATLMNAALVSVLYTLFGYVVGTLSSLAWLMLQLFSYGGIWMVETVPKPFQWLHAISPLTYVRDGYIAAFNGVGGFWQAAITIIVIGLIGLALTFFAAGYQHTRYLRTVEQETAPPITAAPAT